MRKLFTFFACALAISSQAQNIVVTKNDDSQVTFQKSDVKSIEFNPAVYTGTMHYATTDMTYAEFYAGELHQTAAALLADGVDAFTSATDQKPSKFETMVVENNRTFKGVKAVNVAMTDDVYNALSTEQKERYTFVTDAPTEYKMLKADGSFSAFVGNTQKAEGVTATIASGKAAIWGSYVISLSNLPSTVNTKTNVIGAVITASDGSKYGLIPECNLWLQAKEIAFSVSYFENPHDTPAYTHTAGLQGKTITNITYMLKDADDLSIDCSLYVQQQTTATVTIGDAIPGTDPSVEITASNDCYSIDQIKKGSARGTALTADEYSYADGKLTIKGNVAEGDVYIVYFTSEKYATISGTITFANKRYYATTDMTFGEFYAGEVGSTASDLLKEGIDAYTCATDQKPSMFSNMTVADDLKTLTGVKAVNVAMTTDVYAALSKDDKARYTFLSEAPAKYKELNADGSFSKYNGSTTTLTDATVTISSGALSTWGNYGLKLTGLPSTLSSKTATSDPTALSKANIMGVVLTDADNKKYCLLPLANTFFKTAELAFCVTEFENPHDKPAYLHTQALQGKTITNVTYILNDGNDLSVDCNLFVKNQTTATVTAGEAIAGKNPTVQITIANVPDGETYTLSSVTITPKGQRSGSELAASAYSYNDGVLTINGDIAVDGSTYKVYFDNDKYVTIGTSFSFTEAK